MRLPSFDHTQESNIQLAEHVEQAHKEHDMTKRAALVDHVRFEAEQIINAWVDRPVVTT